MEVTSAAGRRAFARGETPPVETVRPGILSVPQGMPGLRLPASFSTLIHDGATAHLIDVGMPHDENLERLAAALASVGLALTDIASITLTHLHRDHAGLAPRLRAISGATVRMHERDARAGRERLRRLEPEKLEALIAEWRVPEGEAGRLREHLAAAPPEEDIDVDEVLSGGETLQLGGVEARVIHTPGHTAGHVCLHLPTEEILVTGDHLLPAISTGVGLGGVWGAADPLASYLHSIERISTLGDLEVLPGHGYRFRGLAERCAEVLAHHARRRAQVAEILESRPRARAWEVAAQIWHDRGWGDMDPGTRISALGQTGWVLEELCGSRQPPQSGSRLAW